MCSVFVILTCQCPSPICQAKLFQGWDNLSHLVKQNTELGASKVLDEGKRDESE